MFISLIRILKFSFQDIWRNIWLSLITVTIMVLALITINFLIVFNVITKIASDVVQDRIDVSVYLKNTVSPEQTDSIKQYLLSLSDIENVEVITPDLAMERFKEKYKDNEKILQSVTELETNPLGYTLVVKAKDPSAYPNIMASLDAPQYSDFILDKSYEDHEAMISKIESISGRVQKAGIIISLIFILISTLIVINTIRIAIYTHREEIGIMRLVGATNWFIRMPFLVESIIFSIVAIIISTTVLYPILSVCQPYLESFFETQNYNVLDYFNQNFIKIFGLEFLGIVLINIIASSLAIRRYLKV